MPGTDYRDSQADLMRAKRQSARIVVVPKCQDRERRELLESDDVEWLMWYFAPESGCESPFTYQFTGQQIEMIAAIRAAIVDGGDQAEAASRGEGKTTLCERLILKYTLQGKIRFSVLFGATGSAAENSLESIKGDVENNTRLLADYPEVCVPVLELENTPNRAHYQLVSGDRHDDGRPYEAAPSKFSWCGQEIILPNVPGSPSAGSIIATRGLDSAVRGLKKKGKRVDVAVIDDPDTEETARSEDQAKKLEARIDKAIGGLGGQKRRCGRVILTTLQSRISASYKFTDQTVKPSWKGRRFRFLLSKPERMDLWDEYIQLQKQDWQNATTLAHELYVANREAMEAGAAVANPNRYSQGELSALQFYFNEVARIGPEAVATEYDNDPPEESGPVESGITPNRIQRQVNGYERKQVPPGCIALTQGIDVRKVALHWVVRGWRKDGTGFTLNYGVHEVRGTIYGSDEGVDVAVKRAILERIEAFRAEGYDLPREFQPLTLVDAGWRTDAVYSACAEAGLGVMPVMGFGQSAGCTRANFSDIQRRTVDRRPGDGWFLSRKGKLWLVCADTDRWKAWEHDRWMTSPDKPGCMSLFGVPSELGGRLSDDEKSHHSYARHICNEVEVEEPYKETIRRRWKAKSENTHWLDASYYSDVAANIRGVRLEMQQTAKPTKTIPHTEAKPVASRPSARELAARIKR